MSAADRARWNALYTQRADREFPPPDLLLLNYTPEIAPDYTAHALDLAGGVGQNGLWLAERGYLTDIVDISRIALDRARQAVSTRGLRNVNLLLSDLETHWFPDQYYDVVCVMRFLDRALLPKIARSIVPGGRILIETFNLSYLDIKPDFNPQYCVQGRELSQAFDGWRVLLDADSEHFAQFVAIKPK